MTHRNVPTYPRLPALPTLNELPAQTPEPSSISGSDSTNMIRTRADFDAFAIRDDVPGALGIREMKFVISGADTNDPTLHFIDSNKYKLHFYFVKNVLGSDLSIANFNRVTYFTNDRHYIVGSVLAFDNYTRPDGEPGLFALQFWPTDPISVKHVSRTYHMLITAMPFAAGTLAYHPSGDLQEQLFIREADDYADENIRTAATSDIFEAISYNPLHLGEAVGKLRLITGTDSRPPTPSDIVIYDRLPNDLPLVAGVITSAPQTPLSHVNLRAQQNDIPNAYLHNAADTGMLNQYLGKIVWLAVTPDAIQIREATAQEQRDNQNARRPKQVTYPSLNLVPDSIRPLDDLTFRQVGTYGNKAIGLAELRRAIDPKYVPNGFAVPFSFYHTFMVANGLYAQALAMMANVQFIGDGAVRKDMLKDFRQAITKASVPTQLSDQLDAMHQAFPIGTAPRCRSSANAEDTVGFIGAGLYDSYTHRMNEGHIEKSIKQVWASLWNFRAFEEREFYRIDHLNSAMGVLVHPNFDEERVNGVAITRNLYFDTFVGYYVNAQIGEDLITNPTGAETAEELLIMKDSNGTPERPYEMIYVRRSSLLDVNDTVIQPADLLLLSEQMRLIQNHFSVLYGQLGNPKFAMDIEFKIDHKGSLVIKQARPWIG